jgi:hypothetical protein
LEEVFYHKPEDRHQLTAGAEVPGVRLPAAPVGRVGEEVDSQVQQHIHRIFIPAEQHTSHVTSIHEPRDYGEGELLVLIQAQYDACELLLEPRRFEDMAMVV